VGTTFPADKLWHIRTKDDYEVIGTVPNELDLDTGDADYFPDGQDFSTDEAAGKDIWGLKDLPECGRTDYTWTSNRPDTHSKYWGMDLRWNKPSPTDGCSAALLHSRCRKIITERAT
jgi:hypothetical protein